MPMMSRTSVYDIFKERDSGVAIVPKNSAMNGKIIIVNRSVQSSLAQSAFCCSRHDDCDKEQIVADSLPVMVRVTSGQRRGLVVPETVQWFDGVRCDC